ncbi:MAG TPA: FAD-dependent oxidoreductase, partial [Acidimicrobiales bacterium]|nr:FAD-dependent oxidoreductase [Acidimicrobiales bacterium]
ERLVDPLVGGIHAGSADELSAAALFPLLLAADQQSGSLMRRLRRAQSAVDPSSPVFLTLRSSTASLAERLAASVRTRGVTLRLGTRVDGLERLATAAGCGRWRIRIGPPGRGANPEPADRGAAAGNGRGGHLGVDHLDGAGRGVDHIDVDAVLLAVPATTAGALLSRLAPRAAAILSSVEHASVATLTLALPPGTLGPRHGTGFLVPRTSTVDGRPPLVTAATYLDRKWPHLARKDHELVRLSVGRHGDLRHTELDDDELVAAATSELASILASSGALDPIETRVTRWPDALPQYAVGHLLRMAAVRSEVEGLGCVALAGSACSGVGIPACISSGREAARRVLGRLGAPVGQAGPVHSGAVGGPAATRTGSSAAVEPDPTVGPAGNGSL